MSFTNQTQHYGLPQYIGSDVPAYLTDYNNAMATIDQGMNAAKTQADSAATAAGQAANDIASLNSTVGTQAAQISAAAQAASNAQTTANDADGKADALDVRVTALEQSGTAIHHEDVTVTNSYEAVPPEVSGKEVFAAVILTSSTGSAFASIVTSAPNTKKAYFTGFSGPNILSVQLTGTVRFYYA